MTVAFFIPTAAAVLLLILLVLLVLLFGVVVGIRRREVNPAPRSIRRFFRRLLPFVVILSCCQLYLAWETGGLAQPWGIFAVAVWVLVSLWIAYAAYRRQTEADAQKNFAYDRRRCGRCAYDLTGNVSGVCSECGWAIPEEPVRVESVDWALWWRNWEIAHLEDWRKRLGGAAFSLVFVVGATMAGVAYTKNVAIAIAGGFISVHIAITVIRIIAYGRRQSDGSDGSRHG